MKQFGLQARAIYDRLFPERQIILRSNGAVRGAVVSSRRQAYATLMACAAAIWCVYASASALGQDSHRDGAAAARARDRARYSRWLNEAHAQAIAARRLVEERTQRIDEFTRQLENRHQVLRWLLEYSRGADHVPPSPQPVRHGSESLAPAHSSVPAVELTLMVFAPTQVEWPQRADIRAAGIDYEVRSAPSADAADQPSSIEFVAYLRDPILAGRVSEVAQRVAAVRAAAAQ